MVRHGSSRAFSSNQSTRARDSGWGVGKEGFAPFAAKVQSVGRGGAVSYFFCETLKFRCPEERLSLMYDVRHDKYDNGNDEYKQQCARCNNIGGVLSVAM